MPLDQQFSTVVGYLMTAEGQIADGTFGTAQRPWLNFAGVKVAGQFDFASLDGIFSRDALNNQYGAARAVKTTTAGTLQSMKLAADYLSGLQRDYSMRTRSRVRMLVHAGNRANANGMPVGPLRRNSIDWLTRIVSEQ